MDANLPLWVGQILLGLAFLGRFPMTKIIVFNSVTLAGVIVILGSGEVVRKLLAKQLVDELILLIHPLVLGDGQRLFDDGGPGALFELADTRTTTTGVIAATYRPTDHGPKGQAG